MSEDLCDYVESYLEEVVAIAGKLSRHEIGAIVRGLIALRRNGGRLLSSV